MDLQSAVNEAYEAGRLEGPRGRVATYIPELSRVDPDLLGLVIYTNDGQFHAKGDVETPFTIQSAGKVFALAQVLQRIGLKLFERVDYEPSGNPFSSMVRLETEQGRPRNPYINSGAIVVSSLLPGESAEQKIQAYCGFLTEASDGALFEVDRATYLSESRTGYRNRAMAYFVRQYNVLADAELAVETYFMQCSVLTDLKRLARTGLFLSNRGTDPLTGQRFLTPECCRIVVTLMTTCGTYDQAGQVAIDIGLPCKSAVSGAVLAIVPGRMSIAAFSPRLGESGNSVAAMRMLQVLSERLGLSLFQ